MAGLITLTTDFGTGSCYVAAMKGVILGINRHVRLVDLGHQIPPQDLRYASVFLQACVPYFPPEAIHVIVVDPGVGSERGILFVEMEQTRLLVPDNGCWTGLPTPDNPLLRVFRLTEPQFWRECISNTFHGRDIFAPAAAHLSLGVRPESMGEPVQSWQKLDLPRPVLTESAMSGEVLFIDDFGNLITNIPGEPFQSWLDDDVRVTVNGSELTEMGRTYADVQPGNSLVLVSSMNTVEIAVNQGNAAKTYEAKVGDVVRVEKVGGLS